MRIGKKLVSTIVVLALSTSTLTGCTSTKKAISESAKDFLEIVKSGSTENLEQYASGGVLDGEFVHTFDSSFLTDNLKSGIDSEKLDEATAQRLDNLCASFSDMITSYEITSVSVKKGVGTVVASVNTAFPLNIIGGEEASSRIGVKVDSYTQENPDKINNADPEIAKQVYNDTINLVLETYEDMMSESSEETYIFVFTMSKDPETHKWCVTEIQDYDSVANGKTIAETNTDAGDTEDEDIPIEEMAGTEESQEPQAEETESEEAAPEQSEESASEGPEIEEVDLSID